MGELTGFQPDWVSPPGDAIADALEERGWTEADFAEKSGLRPEQIRQLLEAKTAITEPIADTLARVLGSTTRFWLALEARYHSELKRLGKAGKTERPASHPAHAQPGGHL